MTSWFGNSAGHALAGSKGGKKQNKKTNSGNFANDRKRASRAGQVGGRKSKRGKAVILPRKFGKTEAI